MSGYRCECHRNELKQLLAGGLPSEDEDRLVRHLDDCVTCRESLESLALDGQDGGSLRALLRPDPWSPPEAFGGTKDLSSFVLGDIQDGGPAHAAERAWEPSLDFLGPSDDPAMLGRMGTYEISGVIGHGGMGLVLKAFDRALHRNVAIKVLASQLAASGVARQRFQREARAAAAVVHEHVIAIHAVAEYRGMPYLVMPYLGGPSLQQRIDRSGPLPVIETVRIAQQVAIGLEAAHAQGLVHRDVKPANILLENGVERVVITDFGLARTIDDASLTHSGIVAGTPQYMAPEQAKGEAIDHRADLFSLGSVMYVMCTGRLPFRAETTMGVLRRLCDESPRPIREINPETPEWLAGIIETLHQKTPDRRFQSGREVAELLGRWLAHLQNPTAVPQPAGLSSRLTRDRRTRLRRIGLVASFAGVLGSAIVGTLVVVRPSAEPAIGTASASANEAPVGSAARSGNVQRATDTAAMHVLNETDWDETTARIRAQLQIIEQGRRVPPEAPRGSSWSSETADLRSRLERLERDLIPQQAW